MCFKKTCGLKKARKKNNNLWPLIWPLPKQNDKCKIKAFPLVVSDFRTPLYVPNDACLLTSLNQWFQVSNGLKLCFMTQYK